MRRCQRFLAAVAVFTIVVSGNFASHSSAQAPVGQADPHRPVFTLSGDAASITFLTKADKTADFEMVLGRLKEALQKSDNTRRREQSAGWAVFKSSEIVPRCSRWKYRSCSLRIRTHSLAWCHRPDPRANDEPIAARQAEQWALCPVPKRFSVYSPIAPTLRLGIASG